MDSSSTDRQSGIESELIDLSAMSMLVLRESKDTVLRQAVRQVMQQTAHSPATAVIGFNSDY